MPPYPQQRTRPERDERVRQVLADEVQVEDVERQREHGQEQHGEDGEVQVLAAALVVEERRS